MRNPSEEWPAWPEMTYEKGELHPDNVKVKKDIVAEYGEDALRHSWLAVCKRLDSLTEQIKEKQTAMIREVSYDDFFKLSDAEKEELKNVGCFVVRGTVPPETASAWFQGLQKYVQDNEGVITGKEHFQESLESHY